MHRTRQQNCIIISLFSGEIGDLKPIILGNQFDFISRVISIAAC